MASPNPPPRLSDLSRSAPSPTLTREDAVRIFEEEGREFPPQGEPQTLDLVDLLRMQESEDIILREIATNELNTRGIASTPTRPTPQTPVSPFQTLSTPEFREATPEQRQASQVEARAALRSASEEERSRAREQGSVATARNLAARLQAGEETVRPPPVIEDLSRPAPRIDDLAGEGPSPTALETAIETAANSIPGGRDLLSGFVGSVGEVDRLAANLFGVLDKAAEMLHDATGLSKGDAFARIEQHFRGRAERILGNASRLATPEGIGPAAARIAGSLPVGLLTAGGFVRSAGGPILGLGAQGALGRADEGAAAAARGGVTGATIGALFPATQRLGRVPRAGAIGAGTTGIAATIGGADLESAALEGATVGLLAAATARPPAPRPEAARAAQEPTIRPAQEAPPRRRAEQQAAARRGERPAEVAAEEGFVIEKPLIEVTPKTRARTDEFLGKDFSELEPGGKAINLNLNRIEGPAEFKQMQSGLVEIYRQEIQGARRGQIALEQTERLADDLGMSVQELLSRRQGQAFNAEELLAARKINQGVMQELFETAKRVRGRSGTQEDREQLVRLMALAEGTTSSTLGATAEAGRALSALRRQARAERAQVQQVRDLLNTFESRTGREIEAFADQVALLERPAEVSKFAREALKVKTSDKLLEAWINGLLSNPSTHTVNALSNSLVSLWSIPETAFAATIGRAGGSPSRVRFSEPMARMWGIVEGAGEGLRMARRAFVSESSAFDPNAQKVDLLRHRAIEGRLGKVVRLPGRFLMAADDFFKSIGYRQEVNARAARMASEQTSNPRRWAEIYRRVRQNPGEEIREAAIENAEVQTFTNRLGPIGRAVSQAANEKAIIRVIAPFIRTPTNIFKFAGARTPFGFAMKEVRDEIRAGGARRDTAIARIGFGSSVMAWASSKAAEGLITGSGPTEPELRRAWFAAGFRPYSIKIGDQWISYARLEPIGTIIGVAADFQEIAGHIDESGSEELASKIAIAASRNITSKTFISGMSALAEVLSDPDRYGQRFINQLAGSVVPSGIGQVTRVFTDPILRDANSSIEAIKRRVPGYSTDLNPMRNIWGEPIFLDRGLGPDLISPLYTNRQNPDRATEETWKARARLRPPTKSLGGVKLTDDEHDELLRQAGEMGKKLVDQVVASPVWDQTPRELRRELIERAYGKGKQAAMAMARLRLLQTRPNDLVTARLGRAGVPAPSEVTQ